jgi:hypothetical protein
MSTANEELLGRLRAWVEAYCPGALADREAIERLVTIVEEAGPGPRPQCWKARRVLTPPCSQ